MVKDIMKYGYVTGKPGMGILPGDVDASARRCGDAGPMASNKK